MKSRQFLIMAAMILAVLAVVQAALMPSNIMLADDGHDYPESFFLPIIVDMVGDGSQETPTPTFTVAATNSATPTPSSTETPTLTPTPQATATETATPTPTSLPCMSDQDNLIRNGGFEETTDWVLHNDGRQDLQTGTPAFECRQSAMIVLDNVGNNVQLNQTGFKLKDNTYYRATFAAYSNTGNDVRVYLHRNSAPYTDYGMGGPLFDLTTEWQLFSHEFLSTNIVGETMDSRLRFWFRGLAADGDVYWFDAVQLEELGPGPGPTATNTPIPGQTPTRTPKPGNTPAPTNTPGSGGGGKELLVYDWNGKVTEANRGFPWRQPPRNNFDWTKPVNYAGGTLHYYVKIKSQPVAQDMRLQFCFWQEKNGDKFGLENCGPLKSVRGTTGNTATWSVKVNDMWKLNGKPIEWHRPRFRVAAVVKNKNGLPVSDFLGWNWNGEDPKKWYPLDWHFKVVVVAPGASFSGWENYIDE